MIFKESKMRVIKIVKELQLLKLNPLTQGNVSIRVQGSRFYWPPHDFPYNQMTEDDP